MNNHRSTIFLIGNEAVRSDNLPFRLRPKLETEFPDTEFVNADPTETFTPDKGDIIIDSIVGIDRVTVFTDLTSFVRQPAVSVHDYDLYLHLSLLKKLGRLQFVTIIGIPIGKQESAVITDLVPLIRTYHKRFSSQNST